MSYSEQNGQVVLTLSPDDYDELLLALGMASSWVLDHHGDLGRMVAFFNRLNEGNPHYRLYPDAKSGSASPGTTTSASRHNPDSA